MRTYMSNRTQINITRPPTCHVQISTLRMKLRG